MQKGCVSTTWCGGSLGSPIGPLPIVKPSGGVAGMNTSPDGQRAAEFLVVAVTAGRLELGPVVSAALAGRVVGSVWLAGVLALSMPFGANPSHAVTAIIAAAPHVVVTTRDRTEGSKTHAAHDASFTTSLLEESRFTARWGGWVRNRPRRKCPVWRLDLAAPVRRGRAGAPT